MNEIDSKNYRCGYVAIVGRPNVGKSTLLNQILHFKLSIVTPKPQTTRHRIAGIFSDDTAQIIFHDTPGLITPRYKLQEYLVRAARSAMADADVLLMLIEAGDTLQQKDRDILEQMVTHQRPIVVAINKSDIVEKNLILEQINILKDFPGVRDIIPISALKNEGVDTLLAGLRALLPLSPPLYPPDQLATEPERFFVSEIIREKIFMHYSDEIPYSTTVQIEEFHERPGRKDYIRATILVERKSQKGILIGKKGTALKKVGAEARQDIEAFLGRPVFLDLFVVVRPKWRDKSGMLKNLGYK